ncbi:M20/M25/M40 family metallo-hydrolase [Camelimonas lactis]|uniref:Acetylornithine deacetylase/succinyl-diaminopimelate desuccinylase-like protein n=1 Tax=Camelimonas lactis TaxID=659006 RepID=A0A4R2GU20_9HYPH|nr:M20/M25/M40 family metallo-hydrolase [Camelimonas lactis]TCO14150.1 acetylornithine deacetylase/succinyl-diaminopimelate desuccinylase-like protein [Camelimonas lactis]
MADDNDRLDAVLAHLDADLEASLQRLSSWLRIPSISTDPAHAPDCRAAADWLRGALEPLGFAAQVRDTPGHPIVLAKTPDTGKPRVLFYGHYDVQPPEPLELWDSPPFEPRIVTLADGRRAIVARGAADDKGQVMTFVEACRAWRAVHGELPVDVTIMVEGEEEVGSKNTPAFVDAHRAELGADVALVCDTGMWDVHTPAITVGLRGLVYEEVTIRAADRDLHSGLFGGAAQNPIRVLSRIIAGLHDDAGRVTLPGFYDGVPETPPEVLAQWRGLGLDAARFLGPVGLSEPAGERDRMVIEQIQSRPTCDVNGIFGGYTGPGAKTVIAAEATAKLSFRLVGDQDPQKVRDSFRAYVKSMLPADCTATFGDHGASRAIALPFDLPDLKKAAAALADEWGRPAVTIGSGGSIPIVGDFRRLLGVDTLLVGFGLDDDRIHSPNEKYDLTSFHKGSRSWARILAALSA